MADEPQVRDEHAQFEDAPLARDDGSWFARELGDNWVTEAPGIYRHRASPADGDGDGEAPGGTNGGLHSVSSAGETDRGGDGLESDVDEEATSKEHERRWSLRRRH